jgi:hypothetical protein
MRVKEGSRFGVAGAGHGSSKTESQSIVWGLGMCWGKLSRLSPNVVKHVLGRMQRSRPEDKLKIMSSLA